LCLWKRDLLKLTKIYSSKSVSAIARLSVVLTQGNPTGLSNKVLNYLESDSSFALSVLECDRPNATIHTEIINKQYG